jgi:heme oxygenase (mycobilin-producing)
VLAVTRFDVPAAEAAGFLEQASRVLEMLAGKPGFRSGRLARAADDPGVWALVTEWDGVGAYRRSLSADVRMVATPLLARSRDEESAFEVLRAVDAAGSRAAGSSRAADADVVGLGQASGPATSDLQG